METVRWSFIVIMTATVATYAQSPASAVSSAVERTTQALHQLPLRVAEPFPASEIPKPERVPGHDSVDVASLDFRSGPGAALYAQMRTMDELSAQPCIGDACRGLWDAEERYFAAFATMYKDSVPFLFVSDSRLGDEANHLARQVCKAKYTIDDESSQTLYRMLRTQDEVLSELKAVQRHAGRKGSEVSFCVPSELPIE